jgi:thymidylate synthase ThyX
VSSNIKANILQDSSCSGFRITTFELEYPRFIHSELMTHRVFSRNAASSRAIPIERMHELVRQNPAEPVFWGANQTGMQAQLELTEPQLAAAKWDWRLARESALQHSTNLAQTGLHKQIANRVTEPFQMMKSVVTATEWANWYQLRNHEAAQPEIRELASLMYEAHQASVPETLRTGEWHVPYVGRQFSITGVRYFIGTEELTPAQAQRVSASCCAQVSYRRLDDSLAKAEAIFSKLIESEPAHLSPVEHQATPMKQTRESWQAGIWEPGITHVDRKGVYWSANFRGWIQLRQII